MIEDNRETDASILVDLDSILDTRLPVVYALHKPTAEAIIKSGYYKRRAKDTFGNIAYSIFRDYYNIRNENILKLAAPTPMLELIKEYCIEANTTSLIENLGATPRLIVNVYPYDLLDSEKKALLKLFHSEMPAQMDIDIIYKNIDEMDPKYILSMATTFIYYDMLEWLEYHTSVGNITDGSLLGISCIAPMLANGEVPTKELTQDHFDNLRAMFGPFTNLVILQPRMFSLE